jgi:hypothetical protein
MDHFCTIEFTLKSFRKANLAMGQGLSNIEAWQLKWNTPQSISKYTERQENVRIKYALSSMQGLCPYMEDAVSNNALLCTIIGMLYTNIMIGRQEFMVKS